MRDLKDFQNELKPAVNFVPIKTVESFPAWIGYDFKVSRALNKIELGAFYSFNSTGGRLHYKDYSGQIKFDQLIKANSFGTFVSLNLNESVVYKLRLGIRNALCFSDLKLENSISLYDQVIDSEFYNLKSLDIYISPLFEFEYLINNFFLSAELRYEIFVVKSPLTINGDGEVYIELDNGDKMKADWDGVRITAGLGYKFNIKK